MYFGAFYFSGQREGKNLVKANYDIIQRLSTEALRPKAWESTDFCALVETLLINNEVGQFSLS